MFISMPNLAITLSVTFEDRSFTLNDAVVFRLYNKMVLSKSYLRVGYFILLLWSKAKWFSPNCTKVLAVTKLFLHL